jgi:UDPglucose--hexose-1-phosphate uridylyltransferase
MNIYHAIESLITYAKTHLGLHPNDFVYTRNQLYFLFQIKESHLVTVNEEVIKTYEEPTPILDELIQYALTKALIKEESVQIFSATIMDFLIPKPSEVIHQFHSLWKECGSDAACKYLYDLSIKSYYIRKRDIDKNIIWDVEDPKDVIITINLSKPEILKKKGPVVQTNYPTCPLCIENVGFRGNDQKESRQNLRTIPLTLNQETWHIQYSPYVYYQEHCIIFNEHHYPMQVNQATFNRLLDFVDQFPHYFIGSNAGLPRIGGSILGHDHYQGGRYTFPLQQAEALYEFKHKDYPQVKISQINWYNSTLRLESEDRDNLLELASLINERWKTYSNEALNIVHHTVEQHNALTPIVHKENKTYVMNIIFRNNRTNEEHPDGIFHAHQEYHHIKKEAIGLIEAMGMFILPGRLKEEIHTISNALRQGANPYQLGEPYYHMVETLLQNKTNDTIIDQQIKDYIKQTCIQILENTAVFKDKDVEREILRTLFGFNN